MTQFEILDLIADSYNPILLLTGVYLVVLSFRSDRKQGFLRIVLLALLLLSVYLLQFIDHSLGLWQAYGSDYSTHTAFALAMVFFLYISTRRFKMTVMATFVAYVLLMLYQQYHTLAGIVSTILAISPILYGWVYFLGKYHVEVDS